MLFVFGGRAGGVIDSSKPLRAIKTSGVLRMCYCKSVGVSGATIESDVIPAVIIRSGVIPDLIIRRCVHSRCRICGALAI